MSRLALGTLAVRTPPLPVRGCRSGWLPKPTEARGHRPPTPLRGLAALGLVLGSALAIAAADPPAHRCPKVLMFDGVHFQVHNDEASARYWGEEVGVDGFLLNHVMPDWDDSVGAEEDSDLHRRLRRFQELYARQGVTENFIKVRLPRQTNWQDADAAERVVENFRLAARLARRAGLRGLALDLEPYARGIWELDPAFPEKPQRAFELGRRIGEAIRSAFPAATLFVFPEVLAMVFPPYSPQVRSAYAVAPDFWNGLIQSRFQQLLIGVEKSYQAEHPDQVAMQVHELYGVNLQSNAVDPKAVSLALGLWPLGKTYTDKRARESPARFQQRLRLAFQEASPYVWIYGQGSAWQKDGPYGQGDVDPAFAEFVGALKEVKAGCAAAGP